MGRRTEQSVQQGRERVADLKAIAGAGSFDERVHNLARYYERTLWGLPPRAAKRPRRLPLREQGKSMAPQEAQEARKRSRRYPSVAPPERTLRRRQHGVRFSSPNRRGWWVRCDRCNRYVSRDGSCIHCDTPPEVSD